MSDASELQRWIVRTLRSRRDLRSQPEVVALAERYFAGSARLSPVDQLEIYREQFWLRHTAALLEDFPALAALLGQERWERVAEEYLAGDAPFEWSLRTLGSRLPDFLSALSWLDNSSLCRDVAQLEWSYVELFDAADAPLLAAAQVSSVPEADWPDVRLRLIPAARLQRFEYPVVDFVKQLKEGARPSPPGRCEQHVLLYRKHRRLLHEPLEPLAARLLALLADSVALEPACVAAVQGSQSAQGELEQKLLHWLARWTEIGVISDLVLPARSASDE